MSQPTYPPQRGHGRPDSGPQHGYPQTTARYERQAPAHSQQDYAGAPAAPSARPPAPAPKARHRWPWVVGIVVAFLVGIGVGGAGDRSTPAAATSTPQLAPAAPAQAAAPVEQEAPAPSGPLTTVGPGTYEVGTGDGQVAPGKYRSPGPDGAACYYARLKNNDGVLNDIIDNEISQGQTLLTVKDSDGYLEVQGCTFEKTG